MVARIVQNNTLWPNMALKLARCAGWDLQFAARPCGPLARHYKSRKWNVILVTVKIVNEPAEMMFIKSLLESAGIQYFVKNEASQNLFGVGQVGTGYNVMVGPMEVQVPDSQAAEAIALLEANANGES